MSQWLPLSPNLSPADKAVPSIAPIHSLEPTSKTTDPPTETQPQPQALPPPSADTYILGRDFRSASRLNYEHYLWHETLGYNLHPTIASSLPSSSTTTTTTLSESAKEEPSIRIADVACGTGIWLTRVAQSLPHAHLDGYDISLSQCPPRAWLPANTTLSEWDLFSPAPPQAEMLGRYDVVHVRLLLVVVRDEDPRPVIRSLLSLLKPGGYLQWDELNVSESYILRAERGGQGNGVAAVGQQQQQQQHEKGGAPVMEGMKAFLGGVGQWVRRLKEAMEECGMEEVKVWDVVEREDLARAFFDNHLAKDEEMAGWKFGGNETKEGRELLQRVWALWKESQGGTVIVSPKVVATGRKPLRLN